MTNKSPYRGLKLGLFCTEHGVHYGTNITLFNETTQETRTDTPHTLNNLTAIQIAALAQHWHVHHLNKYMKDTSEINVITHSTVNSLFILQHQWC